jgi:hypothetical protein
MDANDLKMLEAAFEHLKIECESANAEMDKLLAEPRASTDEGRQDQRRRFIEAQTRIGDAARKYLETEKAIQDAKWAGRAQ